MRWLLRLTAWAGRGHRWLASAEVALIRRVNAREERGREAPERSEVIE